jgi:hypothetical protein
MNKIGLVLIGSLLALLLMGCGGPATEGEADAPAEEPAGSDEFPARDANAPLKVGEKGTVTLGNTIDVKLQAQREGGEPLFELPIKPNTVIDPEVTFTVQVIETELTEDLADKYVAVSSTAFELHAVEETGYGFALKPQLTIHYSQEELAAAEAAGATLAPLQGNLVVLYKEQRSPKWVAMTTVAVDEAAGTAVVSNIAGAGAWRLVAKK